MTTARTFTLLDAGLRTRLSMAGMHGSIDVPAAGSGRVWRRWMAFFGPGVLVAVGYMDPGNWATSLAGGSRFGSSLLVVVFASNLLAMLFQAAAVRLGIGAGMDLAQACRRRFSAGTSMLLWFFCEVAIVACNLAEVIGMAIGLNLLFGIPMLAGVMITFVDVMLILGLQAKGFRVLEAVVIGLVAVIAACFAFQLYWLQSDVGSVLLGFIPHAAIVTNPEMLYLAVGIVGATVMPHNLYLHSAIVQTRRHDPSPHGKREAIRFATIDSNVALGLALFVNAAIMIVAAGVFHRPGVAPFTELRDAYKMLSPLLGVGIASALFGIALLCSGLSSSVTGTLAGQIVMDGFLDLRIAPAWRAFLTRSIAIVPAIAVVAWRGDAGVNSLLIFSQVVLSLQLPFALVPLLMFTTRKRHLGEFAFSTGTAALMWSGATLIVAMNLWLMQRLWTG